MRGRMTGIREFLYLAASAGNLFLALFVIVRARRARGSLPIALLCLTLFVWDIAAAAVPADSRESTWHTIRLLGSTMPPALAWHFVLVFIHREVSLRRWTFVLYAVMSVFMIGAAGALLSPALKQFVDLPAWNLVHLAVLLPFLVASLVLVRNRYRELESPAERNALLFVGLGIAVGALTGLTDYADLNHRLGVGHLGSFLCTLILAGTILRRDILGQQTPLRQAVFVILLVLSAAFVLTVFSPRIPGQWDVFLVVAATAALTAVALYRLLFLRLFERAQRRERLAMIGTMAAGVAHEVKNPLAAIKGAAQFVQKDLEGREGLADSRDYLQLLVGEVDRLNGVVESFLVYARPLEPRLQDVPLQSLLADVVRLQSASLPPQVRIETAFDPELPPAWADPALLTTAVANVLRNAVEAMGEKGGTLSIRTRGAASALRSFAAVEIADTGPGISREHRERIGQPFFTTKAKGTGLGVAIALRIVEAHGGETVIDEVQPHGCRFTFLLPVRTL